jgi:hypothetical protein
MRVFWIKMLLMCTFTKGIPRSKYLGTIFLRHTSFGATIFLALTCYGYNITGLVTKGYHGCKCSGPYINSRWSNHLRNPV